MNLDTILSAIDSNRWLQDTCSLISGPAHGTAVVTYTIRPTTGKLIPTGLTYSPAPGYHGMDTFKVGLGDGLAADTTIICVAVCGALGLPVAQANGELNISPNPNEGAFTVGLSSTVKETAHLVVTNMIGEKVSELNITTNEPTDVHLDVPAGLYFLSATSASGRRVQKLIVQ